MAKEKIMVSINGELQEAKGEILEQILLDREEAQKEQEALEKQKQLKEQALTKLKTLGLTDEEIAAII